MVTYTITFTDELGTASDETGSEITQAAEGTLVTITAKDRAEEGLLFTAWQAPEGLELADDTEEITTFTMPDSNVELAAEYAPLPEDAEALAEEEEIMLADASPVTGSGTGTESDPYIVTTFEELKAALEKDVMEMQYIKVPGGTNIDTTLSPETYSTAIAPTRKKTLIVDGSVTVTGSATSQVLDSLFAITGNYTCLNIKGNGTLTFSANGNNGSNAVVRVNNDATLNVSGGVTLSGKFNTAVYGMAVYNYDGTVNIDDATLTGMTGGVSYGAAIYASGGITNIKNATLKNSVYPGANITRPVGRGTIYVGKDASLTIEDSTIYTIDGVADGYSICQQAGTTKYISDYLGTNQKIYRQSDKVLLSADVTSLTDSVYITDDISEEINTVSLTVEPLITREMISDLACSYSPSNKMTLSNFIVYKGRDNTSDKIEDKNTPYDPNQSYTVMYLFHTKAGFSFSNNLRDNLKDNVTVTGGDFWMADDYGGLSNAIRVFVNIPAASAAGQEVKTVTIQVKPKAERTKLEDFNCQSYTPTGGMGNPARFLREGLNTDGSGSEPTAYDKDTDYSVVYQFPINPGYTIAEGISKADVTINDGQVWKVSSDSDGKNLLVYVNFPAAFTAGQVVKTVTIQVTPKAERTKLNDFRCQSYTPTGSMGSPAYFVREGLNTDGSGSTPTAYDKNKDYSVVYEFPINSGCTIAEDISKADVTINDGQVWQVRSDDTGEHLLVYVNFPAASTAVEEINELHLTFKPHSARKAQKDLEPISIAPDNKAYFVQLITVKEGLNNTGTETSDYDSTKDYFANVHIRAKEGYSFSKEIDEKTVTGINGQVIQAFCDKTDPRNLFVYVNFPAKAAEDPNYVTEAAVQVAAPVAGEKPSINGITVTSSNADKIERALVLWKFDISYVAGQEYSTTVYLEPKKGVTFADDMKLTVNGKVVNLATKDPTDGSAQFRVKITAVDSSTGPNYVTEAAVQIAAPVAGEKPKGTVDIPVLGDNKDKVKKAMMWWSGMLSGNTAFVAGQEYTAIVYLEPKEGVTFADDMKLNVNGKAVDLLSKDPDGSVQFKVMFTATGSTHTHSYGTDWKYDDTNHWHECECGDKADTAAHSFQWVIDKAATKEATGIKHEECTVCGKKRNENTVIDKLPGSSSGSGSHHSSNNSNNNNNTGTEAAAPEAAAPAASAPVTTTTSARTGDSSNLIGWLAVLLISGGAAGAWYTVAKKKKEQ